MINWTMAMASNWVSCNSKIFSIFSKTKWKSRVVLNGTDMLYPMKTSVIPGPSYLELTSPYGWNLVARRYKSSEQFE